MPALLTRVAQVAIKAEGTEGTAETLGNADAAIQVMSPVFTAAAERIDRRPAAAYLGAWQGPTGSRSGTLSFDVYMGGSGAAATSPSWGVLLQACGFGSTVTTDVVYAPITSSIPSYTAALYMDGQRYQLHGCRATGQIVIVAGQPAILRVTLTGCYSGKTTTALLAPTYETTVPPAVLSAAFAIHSYSACLSELTIDLGLSVALRTDANASTGYKSAQITDRSISGSAKVEEVAVATHDFWGRALSGATGTMTILCGSTSGNRITITAPVVQYAIPSRSDTDGLSLLDIGLRFCVSSGNDELEITHD